LRDGFPFIFGSVPFIFGSVRLILAILTFNLDCFPFIFTYCCAWQAGDCSRSRACSVPPRIRMSCLPMRCQGSRQGSRPSSRHTPSMSETLFGLYPNLYEKRPHPV
ncbi:hypothetical protein K438DRAFT_1857754, partial [Mycena galopus ATCC 62051]